jgi:hypothetical protein
MTGPSGQDAGDGGNGKEPVIEHDILRELWAYWDSIRGEKAMPSRADFDPLDIPRLLPNLILFDVEPGTRRLKARLVGTQVVATYGIDYTGRYLDEIDFGAHRDDILRDYYRCLDTAAPCLTQSSFWSDRGLTYSMQRLILPLSDDGRTVNKLLACLAFDRVVG